MRVVESVPEPVVAETVLEPEVKEGSFLASVVFGAKVPGSEQPGPDGNPVSQLNVGKVTKMIMEHMKKAFPEQAALKLIQAKIAGFGAKTSKDLSRLQLLLLVEWADEQVKKHGPLDMEIPAFEPNRGAATKPGQPVTDAQAVDYDAKILEAFERLSIAGRDMDANAIFEDTGYAETSDTSTPQVKAETLKRLTELLAA